MDEHDKNKKDYATLLPVVVLTATAMLRFQHSHCSSVLLLSNDRKLHGTQRAFQRVYIETRQSTGLSVSRTEREIPAISDGSCRHGLIEISYLKALSLSRLMICSDTPTTCNYQARLTPSLAISGATHSDGQ